MEGIQKSLNLMSEEISEVAKQQANLLELMEEVCQQKILIKEKDKRIEDLEQRINDMEQYSCTDDLIISGLETKHRTSAKAMAGDKESKDFPQSELHSLEKQIIQLFDSKGMAIQSKNIVDCHIHPREDIEAGNHNSGCE